MSLSDAAIRQCKPRSKPFKLFDGKGLYLHVQPNGGKWWRFKYHFAGKEKLMGFDTYPEVSLAAARERHSEARKLLKEGKDPSQKKQAGKRQLKIDQNNSFEVVAREWHEKRLSQWSPSHAEKIMHRLEGDLFPKLGHRPVKDITASELLAVVRRVETRGAIETAHRLNPCVLQMLDLEP